MQCCGGRQRLPCKISAEIKKPKEVAHTGSAKQQNSINSGERNSNVVYQLGRIHPILLATGRLLKNSPNPEIKVLCHRSVFFPPNRDFSPLPPPQTRSPKSCHFFLAPSPTRTGRLGSPSAKPPPEKVERGSQHSSEITRKGQGVFPARAAMSPA